jgi:hypothetical protein
MQDENVEKHFESKNRRKKRGLKRGNDVSNFFVIFLAFSKLVFDYYLN